MARADVLQCDGRSDGGIAVAAIGGERCTVSDQGPLQGSRVLTVKRSNKHFL